MFRYKYELDVDVDLAKQMKEEGQKLGLKTKLMTNPKFRVDYGTITACHLMNPEWDIPIVGISSNNSPYYFSNEMGQEEMLKLGVATKNAIEKSGKRAVLLASNSLSHRHFTKEPKIPEDMSKEHVYTHGQYLWDMEMIKMMKEGKTKQLIDCLPEFMDHTVAEVKAGALSWMLSALEFPSYEAIVHAYGNVIGTGNAVVEWNQEKNLGSNSKAKSEKKTLKVEKKEKTTKTEEQVSLF